MDPLIRHLRILPSLIGFASLLLVVKLGSIWAGAEEALHPAVAVANAAETRQEQSLPAETGDGANEQDDPSAQAAQERLAEALPPSGPPAAQLSDAELQVLQQLADRRKDLEVREQEMQQRAALLEAAEARIEQQIEDLKTLQATLEELTKIRDEQEERKIASLVKIYENMKPKDAARIFEELEMDTLLLVADRMKERKLAAIMADMNPAKAKDITVELASLRQLPPQLLGVDG